MDDNSTLTLGDSIRRTLADEIMSGQFGLNEKLDESDLAERFGVSRTPIRDAIKQLAAAGLVTISPRRSAVVSVVDAGRVGRAFEADAELEALAAGWAAVRADLHDKIALRDLNEACGKLVEKGPADAFAAANRIFHDMISKLSSNDSLAAASRVVRVQTAPFQRFQFQSSDERRLSYEEHKAIVDAILAHDMMGAQQATRRHILRSSIAALSHLSR
ncbi:GntR family transcriptional regulator [Mesorhizobium sp. Cs1299R1N3]|uniref:GntR family transcriptional regulator n=1 Tax=Mesorhizobium sp. Cs1299R1N3 TaxID=3015173 RepID=UPI00301BEBF9